MPTNTSNMNLIQPTIGTDSGLTWEQSVNANASTIDAHDHTAGSGVQIPPSGLNINATLPFNNQAATELQSVQFTDQVSVAATDAIYTQGGEFYFNDGAGNNVQLTAGGSVNATTSGISSGTATASFVGSTLVVNAASNTPANIQGASLLIGNNIASSNYLTLQPPNAMASSYSVTLPSIPASQKFLTLDASGNMATPAAYPLPGTSMASQTITQGLLAPRATGSTVAAGGVATGSGVSSYSNSTSTLTTIDRCTITTTGRPVFVGLMATPGATGSISVTGTGTTSVGIFTVSNDTRATFAGSSIGTTTGSAGNCAIVANPGAIFDIDFPPAGTYTYSINARVNAIPFPGTVTASNVRIVAYEL